MNSEEVKDLFEEANNINNFIYNGVFDYNTTKQNIDKVKVRFNEDDHYDAAGTHKVSFDTCIGHYGSSSCSGQLRIRDSKRFWKYFDDFINQHKITILKFIQKKLEDEAAKNISEIKNQIKELQSLVDIYDKNV